VFEAEIDPVMKMLGFCCGQKYVFVPQVLICYGKQLCTVPVNAVYYSYQNRFDAIFDFALNVSKVAGRRLSGGMSAGCRLWIHAMNGLLVAAN